jgi:hypothetical protein
MGVSKHGEADLERRIEDNGELGADPQNRETDRPDNPPSLLYRADKVIKSPKLEQPMVPGLN